MLISYIIFMKKERNMSDQFSERLCHVANALHLTLIVCLEHYSLVKLVFL